MNISAADAVTAGTTTITSVSANFSAAIVGNIVYVTGGTGAIAAARYQVVTFTNASTIIVDRSTGLSAGTGATLNIGGAEDSLATALLANTAGNIIFIKATGTLTTSATFSLNNNQTPSATLPMNQIVGYYATRGDCDNLVTPCTARPTLQAITNSNINILGGANAGWNLRNLILDCNSLANCQGVATNYYSNAFNLKIMNFKGVNGYAANGGSNASTITDSEVTGGSGCTAAIAFDSALGGVHRNWVHDNSCTGISITNSTAVTFNLVTNSTGASSDGITSNQASRGLNILNNTVYKPGRHCVDVAQGELVMPGNIRNNICVSPGQSGTGYCLVGGNVAGTPAMPWWDGNACFVGTGTGNRHFADDTTVNPINAAAPYVNTLDIPLGADPFTNAAGNDYTLNKVVNGGALLQGTGTPGNLPGIAQLGYVDLGALQAQAAAASTGAALGFAK